MYTHEEDLSVEITVKFASNKEQMMLRYFIRIQLIITFIHRKLMRFNERSCRNYKKNSKRLTGPRGKLFGSKNYYIL